MAVESLGPAERLVAGALGAPGNRRFFVQVAVGGTMRSFLLEKEQVGLLAQHALSATARIDTDEDAVERIVGQGLHLIEPADPEFRIGEMQLKLAENTQLIALILLAGSPDDDAEDEGIEVEVTPEQLRAMALVATKVVESGRDICPRCRLPKDPEGHRCPAVNGHHGG